MVKNDALEIVLLGGTGFVGSAILRYINTLPQGSVHVRALVRNRNRMIEYPFVTQFQGDINNIPKDLFPKAPNVIIHFATKNIDNDGTGFEQVNIEGTKNLLELMPDSTIGVIYGSSMSVYGQGIQENVSEQAAKCPQTPLAMSRSHAEDLVLNKMRSDGKSAIALRPRFIIGKEDRFTLRMITKMLKKRVMIGDGSQRFSIIEVNDYANIICSLAIGMLQKGTNICCPLNVGYSNPISFSSIQHIISSQFNIKKPIIKIPASERINNFLKSTGVKKAERLATLIELIGFSHYADVSNLKKELSKNSENSLLFDKKVLDIIKNATGGV